MDILVLWNMLVENVFGSVVITSLFLIFFIALVGHKFGWSLPTYIAVGTPLVYMLASRFIDVNIVPIFLVGIGILFAIALLVLVRR